MKWSSMVTVGCLGVSAGCTAPMFQDTLFEPQPRREPMVARIATDTQHMNLELRQLADQLAALSRNQEVLGSRVDQMSRQLATVERIGGETAVLRRELQTLRADRERLRKEITDDLAARIEAIAARQQAAIRAATAAPRTMVGGTGTGSARGPGYEHTVEAGQTLSQIAREYGKSMEVIMKANTIANPSHIRIGQTLFIPD